jgi:RNA recognition motif-containing protein
MKLFVAGLPNDMDDAELEEFFEKFGTVASAKVVMDRETGKSKGFAFVDMPNTLEAREAIEGLNNLGIGKKNLVVKEATDRPPTSPRPDRDRNFNRPSFRDRDNDRNRNRY